jgi:hypothetical protein
MPDILQTVIDVPSPDKPDMPATIQESHQPWLPASSHPWRNSPIGKARYRPNPFAKK